MTNWLIRPLPGYDIVLSIARFAIGLLFVQHGIQKHFLFPNPAGRVPEFMSQMWWAGAIETTCGALLVVGLLSRPAAFIASGHVAFAYWLAHSPRGFYPSMNGGTLVAVYCFAFLLICFAGPGRLSLDNLLFGRKSDPVLREAGTE